MRDTSDVEFVGEKSAEDIVSSKVKSELECLHVMNTIVFVPAFAHFEKANVGDLAVIQEILDYYRMEIVRRRKSQSKLVTLRVCVLIVYGSIARARKMYAFTDRKGNLRTELNISQEGQGTRSYR